MENNDNSRRDFLVTGLLTALTAAGCSSKKNPFDSYAGDEVKASGETVKLLSVDGEIIEMDKAFNLFPIFHACQIVKSGKGLKAKNSLWSSTSQGAKMLEHANQPATMPTS
jgi:molybdopterin-containing oxidoreductase family iron-sulfur binding subunit